MKRRAAAFLCAILLASLTAAVPAVSATAAEPQLAYVAGASVASRPTYDSSTGTFSYKCTYAGWASVRVNWECSLRAPALGLTLSSHSGSFSGGSASPPRYYYTKQYGITTVCTVAYAAYADGSDWDSDTTCL